MKNFLLLFFVAFHFSAFAQKETIQIFDAEGIRTIKISSDEIFRISITAAPVDEITVKTKSDGEYYNNISLDAEIEGETLLLSSRYREILESGFDKLSAHKVFAMEVILEIPEQLSVGITSNLATVIGKGHFETLFVQLKSGFCDLEDFTGDAVINTYDGDVVVETSNAVVEAVSRHGKIIVPSGAIGESLIKITTINGDITVRKTK